MPKSVEIVLNLCARYLASNRIRITKRFVSTGGIFLLIFLASVSLPAQNRRSLYFSNKLLPDASAMTETSVFTSDDPLYLVLNVSHTNNTIGDLTSVNPETGKRNFWFCFSPSITSQIEKKCVGILAEPLDPAILSSKAVAYTILPAGKEQETMRTELSSGVFEFLRSHRRVDKALIPFTYFIYGRSDRELNAGEVTYSMTGWDASVRGKRIIDAEQRVEEEQIVTKKAVLTAWVKGLASKRNDPALEKAIRASDGAPLLRIVFLQPTYEIIRNDLGIALRKTVQTVYVYKWVPTGKCFAHWSSFGYESLGGGAFNSDLGKWQVMYGNTGYPSGILIPGVKDFYFYSGANLEVDCAPFAGK